MTKWNRWIWCMYVWMYEWTTNELIRWVWCMNECDEWTNECADVMNGRMYQMDGCDEWMSEIMNEM